MDVGIDLLLIDKKLHVNNNPKTRIGLKRLIQICAPRYWDFETERFIDNPNGKNNAGLYLGTEMNIRDELEPIIWCFISGLDPEILDHLDDLTNEEQERLEEAMKIDEEMKLFLVDNSNYDLFFIKSIIEEYKEDYNIDAVCVDYIELNASLIKEFLEQSKGMSVREDQVLLNLSAGLKILARDYDVWLNAFTQTTDEARKEEIRDQRAVKGGRGIPNKVDQGIVSFEPTAKELKMLAKAMDKVGLDEDTVPNIGYHFYKNRGGRFKSVKVWGIQDLGTMEYHDLFCTDKYFNLITDIKKVKIELNEDGVLENK